MNSIPPSPTPAEPTPDWEHYQLYRHVKDAIRALPFYFKTETVISGIMATDIFTLNSTLGATIEDQVVRTLNDMRPIWDPDERYRLYGFVRQPQTFPDVLLRRFGRDTAAGSIILGLELKGWYLLAKEGEPSFRFAVTPAACGPQDLIVVVPWALSNVISGSPRVFTPYAESARYAAEYRNYHWQFLRTTTLNTAIQSPQGVTPYPGKADQISDRPAADPGGNFGRFARTGLMDSYILAAKSELLCGIEARHWLAFFRIFQERRTSEDVEWEIARFAAQVAKNRQLDVQVAERLETIIRELARLLSSEG